jgi:hypothetical protein
MPRFGSMSVGMPMLEVTLAGGIALSSEER